MYTHERIYRYAERKFQASGCTDFPTVRMVAKALGIRQADVVEEVTGCPDGNMMITQRYVCPPDPVGRHFVETL